MSILNFVGVYSIHTSEGLSQRAIQVFPQLYQHQQQQQVATFAAMQNCLFSVAFFNFSLFIACNAI